MKCIAWSVLDHASNQELVRIGGGINTMIRLIGYNSRVDHDISTKDVLTIRYTVLGLGLVCKRNNDNCKYILDQKGIAVLLSLISLPSESSPGSPEKQSSNKQSILPEITNYSNTATPTPSPTAASTSANSSKHPSPHQHHHGGTVGLCSTVDVLTIRYICQAMSFLSCDMKTHMDILHYQGYHKLLYIMSSTVDTDTIVNILICIINSTSVDSSIVNTVLQLNGIFILIQQYWINPTDILYMDVIKYTTKAILHMIKHPNVLMKYEVKKHGGMTLMMDLYNKYVNTVIGEDAYKCLQYLSSDSVNLNNEAYVDFGIK